MEIPLINLPRQHEPIVDDLIAAIRDLLAGSTFSGGPVVESFEEELARYTEASSAIAVRSAIDAVYLALRSLGIGAGDEVVTSPISGIEIANAISLTGATPVFSDIDERTYTLDPYQIETAVTTRTKAVIPSHVFGQTAEMEPIMKIAERHSLWVIEDVSDAVGSIYHGRKTGSIGHLGCFSFNYEKGLGSLGDSGAVVTSDSRLNDAIRIMRNLGQDKHRHHVSFGWNSRMDSIQAAALRIKLPNADHYLEARRNAVDLYRQYLDGLAGVILPLERVDALHAFQNFVVRIQNRDQLIHALEKRSIASDSLVPKVLPHQPVYSHLGYKPGFLPVAEKCAAQFLALPLYPDLTRAEIEEVVLEIKLQLSLRYNPAAHLLHFDSQSENGADRTNHV